MPDPDFKPSSQQIARRNAYVNRRYEQGLQEERERREDKKHWAELHEAAANGNEAARIQLAAMMGFLPVCGNVVTGGKCLGETEDRYWDRLEREGRTS